MVSFKVTSPCADCPFRKEGGIALSEARAREISGVMLTDEGSFTCHKTLPSGEGTRRQEAHCAGALLFALKNQRPTRLMRFAQHLELFAPDKLKGHELVFASQRTLIAAHARADSAGQGKTGRAAKAAAKAPRTRRRAPA